MRLKKSEFRAMVKEVLRELIQEGAFNAVLSESANPGSGFRGPTTIPSQDMVHQPVPTMNPYGGVPQAQLAAFNPMLAGAVQMATNLVTRAKPEQAAIYSAILEDTSRTTLQKMIGREHDSGHRNGMGGLVLQEAQTEISKEESRGLEALAALSAGGDMHRWAAVAMGGRKPE